MNNRKLMLPLLAIAVTACLALGASGVSAHTTRIITQLSLVEYRPGEVTGEVRSKAPGCISSRTVTVTNVATGETWGQTTSADDGTFSVEGDHEPNSELRIVVAPKKLRSNDKHRHVCRKGFAALTTSP